MLRPFDILNDAPNNSFKRSANGAAFIRKVEGLIHCVRARLIRALGRYRVATRSKQRALLALAPHSRLELSIWQYG
jgi:hypothetical protein